MFDLRKKLNIEVLASSAPRFYAIKKFKGLHENLWLVCLQGADSKAFTALTDLFTTPGIRKYVRISQMTQNSPARETLFVQRRVSLNPARTEEAHPHAIN